MITVVRLKNAGKRDQNLEKLQIQTASLMRLNAAWGLEKKPAVVESYRADIGAQRRADLEAGKNVSGV
jgi:hypothetical protein